VQDVIIVGGGIAGLTAAAYLSKAAYTTLLLEKENYCGGLINSFERNGFVFDGGIRAMENSGVLFPMLKQLGLDIEFVKNDISIGLEDQVIRIYSEDNILEYQELLNHFYPESQTEITEIIKQIKRIMGYMEVQYGIKNPAFLDMKEDRAYMIKEILPWMVKYALTVPKITALNEPVGSFLRRYTENQSLLDIIIQHFFGETPAFFALSYLKIYLDYYYPVGGTGTLIKEMVKTIHNHQGKINNNTFINRINPDHKTLTDVEGNDYRYRNLVWAADLKSFYNMIDSDQISDPRVKKEVIKRREELTGKLGNDSVYTLFLALDLDMSYFSKIASEHFFYTPKKIGQSAAGPIPINQDRGTIEKWLSEFFNLTTYEISCPVMRDINLAPPGKTGLIISVLFDYKLTKYIREEGWYEAFKTFCEQRIIDVLDNTIYPGMKKAIIDRFSSTPLTMERRTANLDGAITGWSFANDPMPAENRLPKIFSATQTPFTHIMQAGQWTYSPSGLPISILTGKLAADGVMKNLKKMK